MASASFPSCLPEFNWMLSSDGWNPCRLATPLIANCDQRATPLPAINSGEHYQAPTELTQNPCVCSNIVYALISACSLCQNGNTYTWKDWTAKCVRSFPSGYPRSTDGLSIPSWANFNGVIQSQFDIVRASVIANGVPNTGSSIAATTVVVPAVPPTVTSTQIITAPVTVQTIQTVVDITSNPTTANAPTFSSLATTTVSDVKGTSITPTSIEATFETDTKVPIASASGSGAQNLVTQTPSAVGSEGESGKGLNKGAIAGGVVGGLLLLAILAGGALWWFKRRQQLRVAPSAAYIAAYGAPQRPPSMSQSPFQDQATSPVTTAPYVSPFSDEKRANNYSDYSRVQRAPSPTLM